MGEMAAVLLMVLGAVAAFAASEVVRELERKSERLVDEAHDARIRRPPSPSVRWAVVLLYWLRQIRSQEERHAVSS